VGGGLLIITGAISGPGSIIPVNGGLISINNNNTLTLSVLSSVGIGSTSGAQDAVVASGTITTATGAVLNLGSTTTGRRPTTSPFTPVDTCVALNLNGAINLLSTLTVSTCTVFTATGSIVGNAGSQLNVYGELVVPTALRVAGPAVYVNGTLSGPGVLTLVDPTVLTLADGAKLKNITITGGSIVANGAFVLTGDVTFNSPLVLTGSILVPAGSTFTSNQLVVCNNQATITAAPGGRVVFNGNFIGCILTGDAFSGSGSPGGNGTLLIDSPIFGLIVLQFRAPYSFIIRRGSRVIVTGPTRIVCNGGTNANPCTVLVEIGAALRVLFQYVCYNLPATADPRLINLCDGLPGVLSMAGNVRFEIQGFLELFSGGISNNQPGLQDQFTYPIATFGSLILGPQSTTTVTATGNQINPTIVINSLRLGGALVVNTRTFVPLHPTVLFRTLNGPISGAFASVVINYDTDRSQHPWAYNLGFPTVRVVGNDVVLDPNGNGTNGASGVVPSFVVALFAVLAAFLFRN
jgi:hypothetical protein